MSGQSLELNGVANLLLTLDELSHHLPNNEELTIPLAKAYQQLDLLERYMVTANKSLRDGHEITKWHEIKMNKNKYPLNGGRK